MRIGLDGTPLLGPRSGIGRYVAELVAHLPQALGADGQLRVAAFSLRGHGDLAAQLPPGVRGRHAPAPARLLQAAWARGEHPSSAVFTGRVDVFHGTNFVLPPTGRAAGVVTVHDLSYLLLPGHVSAASRRYRELVPRSLRRAAVVCVPSARVAAEVAEAYPGTAGRVAVTPLGVSPAWSQGAAPSPDWLAARGLTRAYVLFIGSLEPRKSVQTVVDAYRRLGPGADLPLLALAGPAGWGPGLDTSGVPEESIVRLGRQEEADLVRLVAGARALLYPSLYEGFGLPLLEAFACGTPVIASDIPTTREVLADGTELARLFPVGDADALAALLADPTPDPVGARDGRRALAAARTWGETARLTVGAYRRAAG